MKTNVIWGLMRKDFYVMSKQLKFIFVYLIVFTVVFSYTLDGASSVITMLSIVLFMMGINCFAYDEQVSFDKLAASTPATRGQIAASRYLSSLAIGVSGTLLMTALNLGAMYVLKRASLDVGGTLVVVPVVVGVSAIMISIVFPLMYKFGTSKSRLIMVLVVALPAAGVGALGSFFPDSIASDTLRFILKMLPSLIMVVAVAALFISIAVSTKILKNKDF